MEIQDKYKIIKDVKTATRLTKQVKTMLNNMANKINESDNDSLCAVRLKTTAKLLENSLDGFDGVIEMFKQEQKLSGYQLTLFDVID